MSERESLIVLRDHKEPGGVSDTRCARCEGYDLPQNPHAFGCPYDPNDPRPQFGSNGCCVTYEAVEDAMDKGDTGCPACGMGPGWHLTEDQAERSRFDG